MLRFFNDLREQLLQSKNGQVALVHEALYAAGYAAGDEFTIASALLNLIAEGIDLTEYTLRKGLAQAKALGLIAWRKAKAVGKGAPPTIYRLSSVSLIAQKVGAVRKASDDLPRSAFKNMTMYCAYQHRGLIKRRPGEYSRKFLGERLGRSARSTYNYEQLLGDIQIIPNFNITEITADNADTLPDCAEQGPVFLRVYIRVPLTEAEIELENADIGETWRFSFPRRTHRLEEKRFPCVRTLALKLLKQGYVVQRVQQLVNTYRIKDLLEDIIFR